MTVDDLGLFVVEMSAALAVLFAARRKAGSVRLAWLVLGISFAAAALAQAMWSSSEFFFGTLTPYPSIADMMGLASIVVAIAAVLMLPSAPTRATNRGRVLVNGALI